MSKHVISTLSADTKYTGWTNQSGLNAITREVLVKGGAGMSDRALVTHEGVITHVSDEEAAFLAAHPHFKAHQERGFVKIVNVARDPDTVAQAMEKDDGSRPRNPADVEKFARQKGDKTLQATTNKAA